MGHQHYKRSCSWQPLTGVDGISNYHGSMEQDGLVNWSMILRQVNIKRRNGWFIFALSINFDMIWECIWCVYMHYAHVHRELLNLHPISSCIRLWSWLSFGGKGYAWPSQRWSSNTYDGGECWEDSMPAMSDFGLLRWCLFVEDSVLMGDWGFVF